MHGQLSSALLFKPYYTVNQRIIVVPQKQTHAPAF